MSSTRHNLPYITRAIKRMIKKKQRQYNKAKNTQAQKDWSAFRNIRSKVQKLLREARSDFINNKLGPSIKEKPKAFFRYIQLASNSFQMINQHSSLQARRKPTSLTSNSNLCLQLNPQNQQCQIFYHLSSYQWKTSKFIYKVLKNSYETLTRVKPDGIQSIILNETATEISAVLTHIFTQLIRSGTLPHDWKEANISPVLKKGDKTKPENYRLISLTSIACKILEHIMKHLDNHNILSSCQHMASDVIIHVKRSLYLHPKILLAHTCNHKKQK